MRTYNFRAKGDQNSVLQLDSNSIWMFENHIEIWKFDCTAFFFVSNYIYLPSFIDFRHCLVPFSSYYNIVLIDILLWGRNLKFDHNFFIFAWIWDLFRNSVSTCWTLYTAISRCNQNVQNENLKFEFFEK